MADPRIPGSRWVVVWVQSIEPGYPNRSWSCAVFSESSFTIPKEPYPGFEWEQDRVHRYRVIAVLDERSSKLLSMLEELSDWMDDNENNFKGAMQDMIAAVIKGFEKVGRPY